MEHLVFVITIDANCTTIYNADYSFLKNCNKPMKSLYWLVKLWSVKGPSLHAVPTIDLSWFIVEYLLKNKGLLKLKVASDVKNRIGQEWIQF
ncbi:MAG: hypothetical protein R2827_05010 [Bdellovibrionales bacterium]